MNFLHNIFLISDDTKSSQHWYQALKSANFSVNTFSFHVTIDLTNNPSLVVLDVEKQNRNILSFIERLRKDFHKPILLFTYQYNEPDIFHAYDMGVDDCVGKPISPKYFLIKVKTWIRWVKTDPAKLSNIVRVDNLELNLAPRELRFNDASKASIQLTKLEFRLLYYLMLHPAQVIENSTIAQEVWGHINARETALKNTVYRLRQKIESNPSNPQHIVYVNDIGYMFQG